MVSDVPIGVFLSGGIDSSAVAAMMSELSPGNVNSFSIGFTDPSFDESAHARLVASHLGTRHHELVLEPAMLRDLVPLVTGSLDEPLGDASILPTFLLSRFTRETVKVALGGDGGDELFAGSPTRQAHRLAAWYVLLPRALQRRLLPGLVARLPASFDNLSLDFRLKRFVDGAGRDLAERHVRWLGSFTAEARAELLAPQMAAAAGESLPGLLADLLSRQHAREPLNQVLFLDMKLYLEGDILTKVDRASMMASLEARVPLLNAVLVDHVTALPLALKLNRLRSKHLLRQALRGQLPAAILRRPKKGFGIPVARWLQGPLEVDLREALSPDRLRHEGFFSPEPVQRLLDEHRAGRRDHRKQLWTLFMFQRWLDESSWRGRSPVATPAAG